MAHPYHGHRENAVGKRRVKVLMKSGGYANGGGISEENLRSMDSSYGGGKKDSYGAIRRKGGYADGGPTPSRIPRSERPGPFKPIEPGDRTKYADGGAVEGGNLAPARLDKRAAGGGIRKLTPSKRKPHLNVNIVNVSRGQGRRRGLLPPPPAIPAIGGAPALPPPPVGLRPPGLPGMAKGGRMRKGKDYGQGSGEGRLEEFKHMKGK